MNIDRAALLNLPEIESTAVEMTDQTLTLCCRSRFGQALCPPCLTQTPQIRKSSRRTVRARAITGRAVSLE